ncbi:MAG: sn-glycerol-1-phosphate dehydrogenase [Clostridiales bacterium]|jgi:glycerol-1-phosphate dehydrogenase [NAD(P)+]|nr:sn-glycerol-1-phosphate dehydrogenase [Clostridiales bacterium]
MSIMSRYSSKLGTTFDCQCGRKHSIPLKTVIIQKNAAAQIPDLLARESLGKKGLMVCDQNTWPLAGNNIEGILVSKGYSIKVCTLHGDPFVNPDERTVVRILLEFDPSMDFLIAVGSGTINDLVRFISFKTGKPYIVFATAPSMDGYASTVSPLLINGFKRTYAATHPLAIIADTDVLCSAPEDMILAGVGDILGKLTSLADWQLGVAVTGESFCDTALAMVNSSVQHVISCLAEIRDKKPEGIKALAEALIISGIAMMLVGNSRPASGSEHHISHFLEMKYLMDGRQPLLHGTKVGMATLYTVGLYNEMASVNPDSIDAEQLIKERPGYDAWCREIRQVFGPIAQEVIYEKGTKDWETGTYEQRLHTIRQKWNKEIKPILASVPPLNTLKGYFDKVGGDFSPAALNIERELIRQALLYSKEVRTRYTIMSLASDLGVLQKYAEKLGLESDE